MPAMHDLAETYINVHKHNKFYLKFDHSLEKEKGDKKELVPMGKQIIYLLYGLACCRCKPISILHNNASLRSYTINLSAQVVPR